MGATSPHRESVKVAIVGGGCAGLAAAWQLAKVEGYEITVFDKSWRLGGKGASGRDAQGRILEHGLHVWLGFYENAFAMMRECYAEVEERGWGPDAPSTGDRLAHGKIGEAFVPEPHIGVAIPPSDRSPDWTVWTGDLPPAAGAPGTPLDKESNPFTLERYLERCFELLKTLQLSIVGAADEDEATQLDPATLAELGAAMGDPGSPDAVLDWMVRQMKTGAVTLAAVLAQAVTILERLITRLRTAAAGAGDSLLTLILAVLRQTRKLLADVAALDPVQRTRTHIIDIVITIGVGLYRDRLLFEDRGFDAINHLDYKVWLRKHGASEDALESRFLTGIYDLAFAYHKGDINQPQLAAGVALRGALRMFLSYRGSMFWRMRSGMGDAVFAPLFRVLADKGVAFRFMSALQKIEFAGQRGEVAIEALTFLVDAPLDPPPALDHLGCWPHDDPRTRRARASSNLTLRRGEHFHAVVLATGLDDFLTVADSSTVDAAAADGPRRFFDAMDRCWTDMRVHGETVATQSAQVWFTKDLGELGWRRAPGLLTGFQAPFQTIADMTPTLASEELWREKLQVGSTLDPTSVAYFCGVLADADIQHSSGASNPRDRETELTTMVDRNLTTLLDKRIDSVWPGFTDLRKSGGPDAAPCATYARANHSKSDRYTQSLPGSIAHRISPLDCSVANMTIAGDWTANGLDCGCVEAAVMSGMLAAHAITGGRPALDEIIGYDHP